LDPTLYRSALEADASTRRSEVAGRETLEREMEVRLKRLHSVAADLRFEEAIDLLSPSAHRTLEAFRRKLDAQDTNTPRRRRQLVVMYLQRFCSKNEMNSFFGPRVLAGFAPGSEILFKFDHPIVARR